MSEWTAIYGHLETPEPGWDDGREMWRAGIPGPAEATTDDVIPVPFAREVDAQRAAEIIKSRIPADDHDWDRWIIEWFGGDSDAAWESMRRYMIENCCQW